VIEVPRSLIISKFSFPPDFMDETLSVSDCGWIALFLMHETGKGESSKWFPFLKMLSETHVSQPIFWNDEKLKEGASETVQLLVKKQKKKIIKDYSKFFPKLATFNPEIFGNYKSKFPFDNFTRAHVICESRCWYLPLKENGPYVSFMVPGADLLNFGKSGLSIGGFNSSKDAFVITAGKTWYKGEEVTYYYSSSCDDVILVEYGFKSPLIPECTQEEKDTVKIEMEKN